MDAIYTETGRKVGQMVFILEYTRTWREHDTQSRTMFPSFRLVGVLVPVPFACCPLPPNSLLAAEEGVSARLGAAGCEVEASLFPAAGV